MGVDGVFNDRPTNPDKRRFVEEKFGDPRFSYGGGGSPSSGRAFEAPGAAPVPALGDDRLSLSPELPDNPFQALIDHRRRRRRRRHDGDPSTLG